MKFNFTKLVSILVIFFSFGSFVNLQAVPSKGKSYSILEINIKAEILEDGSLLIEEARTYNYRGKFRWAEYRLPLENLGKITDFSLNDEQLVFSEDSGKQPGTYKISQDEDELYVKWYYSARNETRTFTLKYRVEDAVTVYEDVAEFYYKFVGEANRKTIGTLFIELNLPQIASTDSVLAWAHGSINGELSFENGKIYLWVSPLKRKRFWETRVIFPPAWVPNAKLRLNYSKRAEIIAEEQKIFESDELVRKENKQKIEFIRNNKQRVLQGSVFLAVFTFFLLIILYQRSGRQYKTMMHSNISSEIPKDISPAIANYVFNVGQLGATAMVSTLLDLASRGFLSIEEQKTEKKSLFGSRKKIKYLIKLNKEKYNQDKTKLVESEINMVDFIFNDLASGQNEIELEKIKKSSSKFLKWFTKWKKIIKEQWGNKPFYDKESVKATIISCLISVILISFGVVALIYFGTIGLILFISGMVHLFLSFTILRYTEEVKLLRTKLISLKKY